MQHVPRLLPAVVALTLLGGAALSAQCFPFGKRGLRRVSDWSPGQTLTVGRIDRGESAIAITFERDAAFGAILQKVGHRGRRPDGKIARWEFASTPPTGQPRGLWKACMRAEGRGDPIDVTPDRATNFCAYVDDPTHPTYAVLSWSGLSIPGQDARSLFWFELAVSVSGYTPNRAAFASRLGRISRPGQTAFTIDEVHAPIVHAQQPAAIPGLARILVPISTTTALPAANLPFGLAAAVNVNADLEHPARGQQMQFSAIYSADPTINVPQGDELLAPLGKILFFSTEDRHGHYKRFRHSAFLDPTTAAAYYRWCPKYYPVYGPTRNVNFHVSPYPAVLCALQAKTTAWWYDVASHYRKFVRCAMGLTPMRDFRNRLNRNYVGASVFTPTSNFQPSTPYTDAELDGLFADYVDVGIRYQKAFRDACGHDGKVFMEWQKWLKGDISGQQLLVPEDPTAPGQNPVPFSDTDNAILEPQDYARAQILRGRNSGINMSVYTFPLAINDTRWPSFRDQWFLRDREGQRRPSEQGFLADFGVRDVPLWFRDTFWPDVLGATPGLGGLFLDTLGGQGSFLRYPQPNTPPRKLFRGGFNGGTAYVRGVQRMFGNLRARVRATTRTNSHPDTPFVLTEAVQEFYAGQYDFAQHGNKPFPYQAQLYPAFDIFGGTVPFTQNRTDFPLQNQVFPPLWNTVYHEYSRAEALGLMLSTAQKRLPGVTWERWGDYHRMVNAVRFIQGMKPSIFPYIGNAKEEGLIVDRGSSVGVRDPSVPQQVQLLEFLQRMFRAGDRHYEAGRYLNIGTAARPLQLPTGAALAQIDQSPTPSAEIYQAVVLDALINNRPPPIPEAAATSVELHFNENITTTDATNNTAFRPNYAMMHVLHSVWRSSPYSARLGLVFVNWTDQPAKWQADFDPAVYGGFPGGRFVVRGLKPTGGTVRYYNVGSGQGKTTLSWGAGGGVPLRHHSEDTATLMPPRSIQVFWIDPR